MNSAAIARRVAALHLQKEAGISEWLKWFAQPFQVIWKHHKEFVQGPIDDAVDAIIKELAPRLVRAIGEKEVQEDIDEFTAGANRGKFDSEKGYLADPPRGESPDFVAGYQWGFANPDEFRHDLPSTVKRTVIEKALKTFRRTITEEVLIRMLKAVWKAINPKHTFDAIVKAVKKHGWKLGVGFALFEMFEHFALPALLMKITGDPKMLAMASLPIGEVVYAVVFRILGRTPKEVDTLDSEGHLDWYEKNYGAIRLASLDLIYPDFGTWQNRYFVYKHACLMNDPNNLPEIGRVVERIVRQMGTADIYFDDGSFASVQVEQPGEAQTGCGCQAKTAAEVTVDLVAAVRDQELLGTKDVSRMGAKDPGVWMISGVHGPFGLYLLKNVPLGVAEPLVDFGTRASRIKDGKKIWRLAKKYADPNPFKKVTVSF